MLVQDQVNNLNI